MEIGFVGLGLIGGSIAKRFKKNDNSIKVYAYDEDQLSLILAKQDKVLDVFVETLEDYGTCDIIFLCVPVHLIPSYVKALQPFIKKNCILTDVGSTKSSILDDLSTITDKVCFIGGHPMAGSEKSGYLASTDFLFENAFYLLTPTPSTDTEQLNLLVTYIESLGAIPILMDTHQHDAITAKISHLPHVVASALVHNALSADNASLCETLAAGGFKDITRIASSSPTMWENISFSNRHFLINEMDQLVETLNQFKSHLLSDDSQYVFNFFDEAKILRDRLPSHKGQGFIPTYEVNLDVHDEPGIIARIATLLCDHSINIKNIGINNNREHESGVLQIIFYDETSQAQCIQLLQAQGWLSEQ